MWLVCVSGFNMPDSCSCCVLCVGFAECILDRAIDCTIDGRPKNCPLVEIDARDVASPGIKKRRR